jgi:hypothetical protein
MPGHNLSLHVVERDLVSQRLPLPVNSYRIFLDIRVFGNKLKGFGLGLCNE